MDPKPHTNWFGVILQDILTWNLSQIYCICSSIWRVHMKNAGKLCKKIGFEKKFLFWGTWLLTMLERVRHISESSNIFLWDRLFKSIYCFYWQLQPHANSASQPLENIEPSTYFLKINLPHWRRRANTYRIVWGAIHMYCYMQVRQIVLYHWCSDKLWQFFFQVATFLILIFSRIAI